MIDIIQVINRLNNAHYSSFALKKITGIGCAYCGKPTIPLSLIDKELSKNKNLISVLLKYKSYAENFSIKDLPKINEALKQKIRSLFEPNSSTAEHILPESCGGQFKIPNLLSVCRKCNSKRGNIPFDVFLDICPERFEFIKKQLLYLKSILPKLISDNKLSKEEYQYYPECIAQTIRTLTNQRFDIKI